MWPQLSGARGGSLPPPTLFSWSSWLPPRTVGSSRQASFREQTSADVTQAPLVALSSLLSFQPMSSYCLLAENSYIRMVSG